MEANLKPRDFIKLHIDKVQMGVGGIKSWVFAIGKIPAAFPGL
jgi:hypothetical protein